MSKIDDAKQILSGLGIPESKQTKLTQLFFLALCDIAPNGSWKNAKQPLLGVINKSKRKSATDVMSFAHEKYGLDFAMNSRESFRKQGAHILKAYKIIDENSDDPTRPTNSGMTCYSITNKAINVISTFGTEEWTEASKIFADENNIVLKENGKEKDIITITIPDGGEFCLSPGKHNKIQAAIISEFIPRFAPNAEVLYIGDTSNKTLHVNQKRLDELRIDIREHGKIPDVILYDPLKDRVFLFEAFASCGPMSTVRKSQLEAMLKECTAKKIFFTAFSSIDEYVKHPRDLAWETEVWIMRCTRSYDTSKWR